MKRDKREKRAFALKEGEERETFMKNE